MKIIKLGFILIFTLNGYLTYGQWPTNGGVHVIHGFGTKEKDFQHGGLDVPGDHNSTLITAVHSGILQDVLVQPNTSSINIIILLPDGKLDIYSHCEQINLGDLYTGTYASGITPVNLNQQINAGVVFAKVVDHVLGNNSIDHVHYAIANSMASQNGILIDVINPFSYPGISSIDPGNIKPALGPLFINQASITGDVLIPPTQLYIFGQVDIIREITDDESNSCPYSYGISSITSPFTWPVANSNYHGGDIASPHKISFGIKDYTNSNFVWPLQSIVFNNWKATFNDLFEDQLISQSPATSNSNPPPFYYCYRLTNINNSVVPSGIEYRHWNTIQKIGQPISAAVIIDEAQFKDGLYYLHTEAEDVRGIISKVEDDKPIKIDNFKPYVKKVEVFQDATSNPVNYSGEWQWTTHLALDNIDVHQRIKGDISPSAQSIYFVIDFSEPVKDVTCRITTMNEDAVFVSNSPDQKQYKFIFSNAAVISNASGLHTLSINATDLADNNIVGLNENLTTYYTELPYRNTNGTWTTGNPAVVDQDDRCHHFEIGCVNGGNRLANGRVAGSCMDADYNATANGSTPLGNGGIAIPVNTNVQFTDLTAPNAASWFWDFGDGGNSTSQNATHTYLAPGSYDVTLTSYSGTESDYETKTAFIQVIQSGSFTVDFIPSAMTVAPGGLVTFTNISSGIGTNATYDWEIHDGTGGNPQPFQTFNPQPIIYGNTPNTNPGYEAKLTITCDDPNGGQMTQSATKYISVDNNIGIGPLAPFIVSATPHTGNPNLIDFVGVVSGGTPPYYGITWTITSIDGVPQSLQLPSTGLQASYQFGGISTYTIQLTVSDQFTTEDDTKNYSLTTITVNIGSVDIDLVPNTPACYPNYEFIINYTSTPNANYPFVCKWILSNSNDPSQNYTITNPNTYYDYGWLGTGNWTVVAEVWLYGTRLAYTMSQTIPPVCSPPAGHITSLGFSNGQTEPCDDPSSNTIFDVNPLLTPQIDYTGILFSNTFSYNQTNCGSSPNHPTLCFNTLSNVAPTSIIPNGWNPFQLFYELNTIAESGTNPVTKTWELKIHMNKNDDGDIYYDTETRRFTGTYYLPITVNNIDLGQNVKNICPGASITLGGSPTVSTGKPPYTISWTVSPNTNVNIVNPNTLNPVFQATASASGDYTVMISISDGCTSTQVTKSCTVHVEALQANAGTDESYCNGTSNIFLHGSAMGGSGIYNYVWSVISNTNNATSISAINSSSPELTLQNTGSTQYKLTVVDATSSCSSSNDNVTITVNSYNAFATGNDVAGFCPGHAITLNGTVSNLSGSSTWDLHNYGDPANPICSGVGNTVTCMLLNPPILPTSYVLRVNDGGCIADDVVYVLPDLSLGPQVSLGSDKYLCPGTGSVILNSAITGGSGTYTSLAWTNSSGTNVGSGASYSAPYLTQNYRLTVIDNTGCIGWDDIKVNASNIQLAVAKVVPACPSGNIPLLDNSEPAVASGGFGPFTYEWTPHEGLNDPYIEKPLFNDNATTTYTLHVTDNKGCITSEENRMAFVYSFYGNPTIQIFPNLCEGLETRGAVDNKCSFPTQGFYFHGTYFDPKAYLVPTLTVSGLPYSSSNINLPSFSFVFSSQGLVDFDYSVTTPCGTNSATGQIRYVDFTYITDDNDPGISHIFWGTLDAPTYANYSIGYVNGGQSSFLVQASFDPYQIGAAIYPTEVTANANIDVVVLGGGEINFNHEFTADYGSELWAHVGPACIVVNQALEDSTQQLYAENINAVAPNPNVKVSANVKNNNAIPAPQEPVFKSYPIPSSGSLTIEIMLPEESENVLFLEDLKGSRTIELDKSKYKNRIFIINLNRYELNQGVYNLKLIHGNEILNSKVVLIR